MRNAALWSVLACALTVSSAQAKGSSVGCPSDPHTFNNINTAIAAANPGDTIIVCPGTYFGSVNIDKADLTLIASPEGTAKITPNVLTDRTVGPGVQFNANGDTLEGFVIYGWDNGIFAGDGTERETIKENLVYDNNTGISFHNSVRNKVIENEIVDNEVDGILDFFGGTILESQQNTYKRNQLASNVRYGIFINTIAPLCPYERAEIIGNWAYNNIDGIYLNNSNRVTIKGNQASYNNQDGIELEGSSYNLIAENDADQNGASALLCGPAGGPGNCIGIRAHSDSVNNEFVRNSAFGNRVFDADDNSNGNEPGHVDNEWERNRCRTSSPKELCEDRLPPIRN